MPRPLSSHRHPDLFAPEGPPASMAVVERTELLALVSALLTETLATDAMVEAGDEDHA